jgi:phosphoglycerate dehydrogenase-like enzyme
VKSILVPAAVIDDVRRAAVSRIEDVELLPYAEDSSGIEGADRAEGIFRWIAGKRFSELIGQLPKIHWLHTASAGVDHVLTPTVRSRIGIVVTDSGPAFGPAISEFVLATMLSVARKLPEIASNQRDHRWQQIQQQEIYGTTIGIIGLGPIGLAIAKLAKAFGMVTLGYRHTNEPAEHVDEVLTGHDGLQRILRESDYVILAAALTSETNHLIGEPELSTMKSGSWLINIARGALVNEPALVNALASGKIGGAILDVFAQEPLPTSSPLWNLPNVIVSPHHSGGGTAGLRSRQIEIFVNNVRKYADIQQLDNVVDLSRGY